MNTRIGNKERTCLSSFYKEGFTGNLIAMLWVKRDFFSRAIRVLLSNIIFPSVFMSHRLSRVDK